MSLRNNENGYVNVWVTVVSMLSIIVISYTLTYNVVCIQLYDMATSLAPLNVEAGYFNTLLLVKTVYNIFPWLLCFGVIIWGFLSSQRKEYETGYR